jgi:hypothetical protein
MFESLYDKISFLWVWQWPTANGEVTEVLAERLSHGNKGDTFRLSVTYKFSVGSDEPLHWRKFLAANVLFCAARPHCTPQDSRTSARACTLPRRRP